MMNERQADFYSSFIIPHSSFIIFFLSGTEPLYYAGGDLAGLFVPTSRHTLFSKIPSSGAENF